MKIEYLIALRYLKSRKKEKMISITSFISVFGIFLGVMALIVILSLTNGFQKEIRTKILGNNAHIYVLSFRTEGITDTSLVLSVLRNNPDIISSSPFIYQKSIIKHMYKTDGIVVRGVVPESEILVTNIDKQIIRGKYLLSSKSDTGLPSILLGRELADRLFADVGDTVVLVSLSEKIGVSGDVIPRLRKFVVSGVFFSGFLEFDANLAYISLEEAQSFFQLENSITGFGAKVKHIYRAPLVAKEILKKLGFPYRVNDWSELNRDLFTALRVEKTLIWIVLTLLILVAAFVITTSLLMLVLEKKREVAILQAFGADSRMISKIFMTDGLVIGGTGTFLGLIFGFIVLKWVVNPVINFIENIFHIDLVPPTIYFIDKLPYSINPLDITGIIIISIGLSILAAWYPSFKASRVDPVEVLRYE